MIPAHFDYVRATSREHVLHLLGENGDEAKLLAGGQSLLPLMKLRLATPEVLVDLADVDDLSGVRDDGDHVVIGARTRHADLADSPLLRGEVPLLAHVAGQIGDPQVRHRGTIGGSVAHADPASDLPAALIALRAEFVIAGAAGTRTVAVDDFFTGFMESALEDEELLVEIRVPYPTGRGWSFQKFNRRAQDWAIVGVACQEAGGIGMGLVNMASTPIRAVGVEEAVAAGEAPGSASARAGDGTAPVDDINGSAEYRRHLASVLVRRALEEMERRAAEVAL